MSTSSGDSVERTEGVGSLCCWKELATDPAGEGAAEGIMGVGSATRAAFKSESDT